MIFLWKQFIQLLEMKSFHINFFNSVFEDCLLNYNIIEMGQKQSKTIKEELVFNQNQWQKLSVNEYGQKCNNLFVHRKMRIWAEREAIICNPHHNIQQQLAIYHYRKSHESAIVNVYAAQHLMDSKAPLCGNSQLIDVVYERIPVRLSSLSPLNFLDSLYVLSQSIRGFKECFEKVGLFEVTEDMIGFSSEGFVKVWLNENFAQNHPQSERLALQVTNTDKFRQSSAIQQKMMLEKVLDVVEKRSENRAFPRQFSKSIRQTETFADAYCQIQRFCQANQLWIPDRVPLTPYFNRINNKNSQLADFKTQNKYPQRPQSNVSSQHATYIPNLAYEYPRNTYVNQPYIANQSSKMNYNQKMQGNKFNPIIYGSRPSANTISENARYPQPTLVQNFPKYPEYYVTGQPK